MQVNVRNGNVGKALSIFRKKCNEVIIETREREFYEKPTTKRKRKKRMAVVRERKRQSMDGRPI